MRNKEIRATKLWGGRFTKEANQLVHNFNESLSLDQKFYRQDIKGSIVHVKTLVKQGILTEQGRDDIIRGLKSVLENLDSGKSAISSDSGYEDIHSFVKETLTEWTGEVGRRLYTGRSHNDQIALDTKLYTRDEIDAIEALAKGLLEESLAVMERNTGTFVPDLIYLQKAQPITLAHHAGAYFEMLSRNCSRLKDIHRRTNYCPPGLGALAGAIYPLDREYTAESLGFDGPTLNSMDSVADRDYLIKLLSALPTISMHLPRFCEEIIMWNIGEHRFVKADNSYSTGSSIASQRKNPDIAGLIRGKSGHVYGALASMLTTMKGISLTYNKDMQEDKELTLDATDTVKGCLALFADIISLMNFRKEVMGASAKNGFTNVTDAADYLVNKGVPFRDTYGIAGQLVLTCISRGIVLDNPSLKEYKVISPVLEEDVYETTSMKTCMEKRLAIGAPGQEAMERVIGIYKRQLGVGNAQ